MTWWSTSRSMLKICPISTPDSCHVESFSLFNFLLDINEQYIEFLNILLPNHQIQIFLNHYCFLLIHVHLPFHVLVILIALLVNC